MEAVDRAGYSDKVTFQKQDVQFIAVQDIMKKKNFLSLFKVQAKDFNLVSGVLVLLLLLLLLLLLVVYLGQHSLTH